MHQGFPAAPVQVAQPVEKGQENQAGGGNEERCADGRGVVVLLQHGQGHHAHDKPIVHAHGLNRYQLFAAVLRVLIGIYAAPALRQGRFQPGQLLVLKLAEHIHRQGILRRSYRQAGTDDVPPLFIDKVGVSLPAINRHIQNFAEQVGGVHGAEHADHAPGGVRHRHPVKVDILGGNRIEQGIGRRFLPAGLSGNTQRGTNSARPRFPH